MKKDTNTFLQETEEKISRYMMKMDYLATEVRYIIDLVKYSSRSHIKNYKVWDISCDTLITRVATIDKLLIQHKEYISNHNTKRKTHRAEIQG